MDGIEGATAKCWASTLSVWAHNTVASSVRDWFVWEQPLSESSLSPSVQMLQYSFKHNDNSPHIVVGLSEHCQELYCGIKVGSFKARLPCFKRTVDDKINTTIL